jgi:MarR-like DNA-binding transcriptional regulator SgrR of sgrS sRNA
MRFSTSQFVTLMLAASPCAYGKDNNQTYSVSVRTIPKDLYPRQTYVNVHEYILSHVYYPLFERRDGNLMDSRFLDMSTTRATNRDFTAFTLCLKSGTKFSDGTLISQEDLFQSLQSSFAFLSISTKSITKSRNESCVDVSLSNGDPEFFERCRTHQCTILKSSTEKKAVPIGVGPFEVETLNQNEVTLVRNGVERNRLNRIEFKKFISIEDSKENNIDDWNHIYQVEIPQEVKKSSQEIKRPVSKSYTVIVRVYDQILRKKISTCLDRDRIREATKLPLKEIPGMLPFGFPGFSERFEPRKTHTDCLPQKNGKSIPFYNYSTIMSPGLESIFSAGNSHLPVPINVVNINSDDAVTKVYKSEEELLVIVGVEYSEIFLYGLFRDFIDGGTILKKPEKTMVDTISRAKHVNDRASMETMYGSAHRALLDSGFIVPLGQLESTQYYPKRISNIQWLDSGPGYPRLDLISVK